MDSLISFVHPERVSRTSMKTQIAKAIFGFFILKPLQKINF